MVENTERTGGKILIDTLLAHGADTIFGVPGESYLAALDALYDSRSLIRYITCRQEGGAAFMAAAWSDATSKPGLCFVTRGPGVSNAMIGLHTAYQGSTPLILLIGQIPRHLRDRQTFQEIDYRRMLGEVTKWVAEVDDPARLPEYVCRAYKTALSGRPGPVALALPEDMLATVSDTPDIMPHALAPAAACSDDISKIGEMLEVAERPLLLLGGTCWSDSGLDAAQKFAERHGLPVAVSFRRHGLFSSAHEHFIGSLGNNGMPMPNDYAASADLVIALNVRFNSPTSLNFSIFRNGWGGKLIHCLPGPEDLGRLYNTNLSIQADPNFIAKDLAQLPVVRFHGAEARAARQRYLTAYSLPLQAGPVDMAVVMEEMNATLPDTTTMSTGAGNATIWANKHYCYGQRRGGLSPISGAMGYGVPAAIAAKLARPEAPSVCLTGDGDFLMNGQELATAIQYDLNPIFIIIDNEMYGTIRAAQEMMHPERLSGTALKNPDFAQVAEGYGAFGARVDKTEDFKPALENALSCGRAAVIHVRVGPNNLGPIKNT